MSAGVDARLGADRGRLLEHLRQIGAQPAVVAAMGKVPREAFVPPEQVEDSYLDVPILIGPEATISAPSMVASMISHLKLSSGDLVLEVGLGSGYAAAVMATMGARLVGLEIDPELTRRATLNLAR